MRLLRNILLAFVPILLMINIYRFVFYNEEYTFRGLAYVYSYIGTFNGFDTTMSTLDTIYNLTVTFSNVDINGIVDVFTLLGRVFMILFNAFSLPIVIVYDVVLDILWVLRMFMSV